jgi:hypothetical protein
MHSHTPATRTALRLASKATRLTQSEINEILIRRYLPDLLTDIRSELGDDASSNKRCEFAARNTSNNCRHVALLIRASRLNKRWSINTMAKAINCHPWNYQKIEAGLGTSCTANQATKAALALEDEELTNHLKRIGWWRGAET